MLLEREFKNLSEPVFKIGMTKHTPMNRLTDYPKGSKVHLVLPVYHENVKFVEDQVLEELRDRYKSRLDVGKEYIQGDERFIVPAVMEKVCLLNKLALNPV